MLRFDPPRTEGVEVEIKFFVQSGKISFIEEHVMDLPIYSCLHLEFSQALSVLQRNKETLDFAAVKLMVFIDSIGRSVSFTHSTGRVWH